jgi:hypothetical protein
MFQGFAFQSCKAPFDGANTVNGELAVPPNVGTKPCLSNNPTKVVKLEFAVAW